MNMIIKMGIYTVSLAYSKTNSGYYLWEYIKKIEE